MGCKALPIERPRPQSTNAQRIVNHLNAGREDGLLQLVEQEACFTGYGSASNSPGQMPQQGVAHTGIENDRHFPALEFYRIKACNRSLARCPADIQRSFQIRQMPRRMIGIVTLHAATFAGEHLRREPETVLRLMRLQSDKLREVEAILDTHPEIRSEFSLIGLGAAGQVNQGTVVVRMVPRSERTLKQQEVIPMLREEFARIAGARVFAAPYPMVQGARGEPLQFVLVGDGHEKARLQQRVQAEGLAQVSLLPAIPKAQIPSFLSAIDIAYIGWQRVPIYRFGIAPNKLMDYMMAGCAVLHSVEAGNDPVAEAGCGFTVPPQDAAAVAEGLKRLRGPIGIYIGSKTPPEIAVSVMAEILAVKNGVALPRDMDVAQAKNDLDIPANDPGVLVCGVRRERP